MFKIVVFNHIKYKNFCNNLIKMLKNHILFC